MSENTTITSDPKIAAVERLYAAYGRGDMEAVQGEVDEHVDWAAEATGTSVPWWGNFRGRAEVPRFFEAIASSVEISEFDIVSITSNDTDVVSTVHWTFTVRKTGKTASMYMQHWWRFANDKIVFFRGSEDSEQSARAFS